MGKDSKATLAHVAKLAARGMPRDRVQALGMAAALRLVCLDLEKRALRRPRATAADDDHAIAGSAAAAGGR